MRGLAVVLMVLDHALAVFAADVWAAQVLRVSLTRFSFPLFMISAGMVARPGGISVRRLLQISGACLLSSQLVRYLGIGGVGGLDVLGVFVLALGVCAGWVQRHPVTAAILGFIQVQYWAVPIGTYQPGAVWLWFAVGVLALRVRVWSWGGVLPAVGRYPLSLYLGHLLLLAVLKGWIG